MQGETDLWPAYLCGIVWVMCALNSTRHLVGWRMRQQL